MSPLPDGDNKPSDDGLLVQTLVSGSTTSQSRPSPGRKPWLQALYHKLTFTPPRCRHDPTRPFKFSMGLNVLFAFAGCFTVANLYYTHPILHLLAQEFNVTGEQASYIPTLAQAGYAAGLLFLCPLGDLVKRRGYTLWLVWFTATVWIGLCLTNSYILFCVLTFITGATTVTPQLMLPLVGDMAPAHRRATSLSIVVSGMLLGMLTARLLAGVVAQYIGWRYIYWISFALQYLILTLLYLFMPDYPATNPAVSIWRQYPSLLLDILKISFRNPVVIQSCLIGLFTATSFTCFWTTLTFLLSSPPYNYETIYIGLFALSGIGSMIWAPVFARTVMEKRQPLFSVIVGETICLVGVIIGTYSGKHTVVGPILQGICIDIGLQTSQIANRTSIYEVAPKAKNRVNTAYMVSVFSGQLVGTAVGNALYARAGWYASGSASVAFVAFALFVALIRGPHETGWVGWHGGMNWRKPIPGGAPDPEKSAIDILADDTPVSQLTVTAPSTHQDRNRH